MAVKQTVLQDLTKNGLTSHTLSGLLLITLEFEVGDSIPLYNQGYIVIGLETGTCWVRTHTEMTACD